MTVRGGRVLFAATIFAGSLLLFLVQPLIARLVLPRLGGSPSVWTVAMLFYQAALLGGYLYAHLLQRFGLRTQVTVHLAAMVAAAATLPVAIADLPLAAGWPPAAALLAMLGASIGPVFVVVAAQAPLLQAWFSRSADPAAAAPYFLYAASNAGSLAALIAYPLLVEPALRLGTQARGWSGGYAVLLALTAAAGVAALRHTGAAPARLTGSAIGWRQRLRWTVLALVPSGLLLSTTTHLTTDVMAVPLLWVVPLAVYLLSFIIAFGRGGARATRIAVRAAPPLILLLGGAAFFTIDTAVLFYAAAGIVLLFVVALALHGTLAAERPAPAALTQYYLWVALGGALGGLACAVVAPLVFDWGYEHPLLLVAAALLVPARPLGGMVAAAWARVGLVLRWTLPLATLGLSLWGSAELHRSADATLLAVTAIIAAGLVSIGHRATFAWHFVMLLLALGGWRQFDPKLAPVERSRSFFGIYTVRDSAHRQLRELQHGTTLHGVESLLPTYVARPTSYYAPGSGAGLALAAAPKLFGSHARIGFVGLGAGTLACYARAGQTWTAFEIDPAMVALAHRRFSYIAWCKPDLAIAVGDARLRLAAGPPSRFEMLAVDAFSSDAIPLHLLTCEAFAVYMRALAPGGVLLVHVSNRYLDLEPVVAGIAAAAGLSARVLHYVPAHANRPGQADSKSNWIALTRTPQEMAALLAASGGKWQLLRQARDRAPWSDDFAAILPALRLAR